MTAYAKPLPQVGPEMAPFFEGTGSQADTMMEELVEVFHLD